MKNKDYFYVKDTLLPCENHVSVFYDENNFTTLKKVYSENEIKRYQGIVYDVSNAINYFFELMQKDVIRVKQMFTDGNEWWTLVVDNLKNRKKVELILKCLLENKDLFSEKYFYVSDNNDITIEGKYLDIIDDITKNYL